MPRRSSNLQRLERLRRDWGDEAAATRVGLIRQLESERLRTPAEVARLHDLLLVISAYPDDLDVRRAADAALRRFPDRWDLARHRRSLAGSGIAGTEIRFSFFAATALWLAAGFPGQLRLDWGELEQEPAVERYLGLLALPAEQPGLDQYAFTLREWIERLKAPDETDAAFLLRRFARLPLPERMREILLDGFDLPLVLEPGEGTPSRTLERWRGVAVVPRRRPMDRRRPDLRATMATPPESIERLDSRSGRRLLELARGAMVTRARDLDAFAYGNPADVLLATEGEGLVIAWVGLEPDRRFLLEGHAGYLLLQNGVPIGYGTVTALYRSAEVAFTLFEAFRDGETARLYSRILAQTAQLFGCDTFTVDPYQFGLDNEDAIRSGAFWFYRKLGFVPREPEAVAILQREEEQMRRKSGHRSRPATLRRLARDAIFLDLRQRRDDVLGHLDLSGVGLAVTDQVARRFGSDRERARRVLATEALERLGLRRFPARGRHELAAWKAWAPLVTLLPGLGRWSDVGRRQLVEVIRARGGRHEMDYVRQFDGHLPLRRALVRLARESAEA